MAESSRRLRPGSERAKRIETRAEELLSWCRDTRRDAEGEWDAATDAFYDLGPTHIDDAYAELRDIAGITLPPPRIHARMGVTRLIIQQLVAVICQEPLRFRVQPRSDELEHQIASISAQALCDHWKDAHNLDAEQERLALMVALYNAGYLAYGWNPYAGPVDPDDPKERLGDVFFRAASPREFFPDPAAVDGRDRAFLFRERTVSLGSIPRRFRKMLSEMSSDRGNSGLWAADISGNTVVASKFGPFGQADKERTATLTELYVRSGAGVFDDERERVSENDDEGLYVLLLDGHAIDTLPNPYDSNNIPFPFAQARYVEDPERNHSAGVSRVLVENDVVLSELSNALLAHQVYGRKPKLLKRPDLDLRGSYTREAVEEIEGESITESDIRWIQAPPWTSADQAVMQMVVDHSKESAGAPNVWFGQAGENLNTASALAIARSGSELRARLVRRHVRQAFKEAMFGNMQIASTRMPSARMIETLGPSYPVRKMAVDGTGLSEMNVDVFDDPSFSSNPTIRFEQVKGLVAVLPEAFDAKQVREWLMLPQSETDFFDEDKLQRARADEQAWRVLRGEAPPELLNIVPQVDNPEIHIARKRLWALSAVGQWARQHNPEGHFAVLRDIDERRMLVQKGIAQMQAGAAPPGGENGPMGEEASQDQLTPDMGGGTEQPAMGGAPLESQIGRMNPAMLDSEAGAVFANRERVTGGEP